MGKIKRKGIFKSIFNGILDVVKVTPIVAPFTAMIDAVKSNVNAEEGGTGKIDYIRLAFALGILISVLAFAFGKIDFEMLEKLIKLLY